MGMSYCSSLGDMSEQPVAGNDTSLSGRRLTSFIGGNDVLENTHFRPDGIVFTDCQNLETLILTNSDNLSGTFSDETANMVRLRELKLKGTKYTAIKICATDKLETVELPNNLDTISMYFWKISDHKLFHVRPKGQNKEDLAPNPHGGEARKYCYWFNKEYITDIVNKHKQ